MADYDRYIISNGDIVRNMMPITLYSDYAREDFLRPYARAVMFFEDGLVQWKDVRFSLPLPVPSTAMWRVRFVQGSDFIDTPGLPLSYGQQFLLELVTSPGLFIVVHSTSPRSECFDWVGEANTLSLQPLTDQNRASAVLRAKKIEETDDNYVHIDADIAIMSNVDRAVVFGGQRKSVCALYTERPIMINYLKFLPPNASDYYEFTEVPCSEASQRQFWDRCYGGSVEKMSPQIPAMAAYVDPYSDDFNHRSITGGDIVRNMMPVTLFTDNARSNDIGPGSEYRRAVLTFKDNGPEGLVGRWLDVQGSSPEVGSISTFRIRMMEGDQLLDNPTIPLRYDQPFFLESVPNPDNFVIALGGITFRTCNDVTEALGANTLRLRPFKDNNDRQKAALRLKKCSGGNNNYVIIDKDIFNVMASNGTFVVFGGPGINVCTTPDSACPNSGDKGKYMKFLAPNATGYYEYPEIGCISCDEQFWDKCYPKSNCNPDDGGGGDDDDNGNGGDGGVKPGKPSKPRTGKPGKENKKPFPWWAWLAIGGGVLLLIIIIVIVVARRKR